MSAPAPTTRKAVKKGLTAEGGRKHRETAAIQLRKEKREDGIAKKRNALVSTVSDLEVIRVEDLPHFTAATFSSDTNEQLRGVVAIRKLLSQASNPPVDAVIAAGLLPRLVQLLQTTSDAKLLFETTWAITNVASTDRTSDVVAAGAIAPLVQLLFHADPDCRDQATWCIGNIAGDSPKFRDMLFGTPNAVQGIFLNVQHPASLQVLRNATWALSNFCRGKPSPPPSLVKPLIPALTYLVQQEDKDVVSDAAWGLSHLTEGDDSLIEAVVASGILPRLVSLMGHPELVVVMPALRVTGNIISGNERHTQAALDAGSLRGIAPLLSHSKRNVRREACWTISNVAAGTQPQISEMMTVPGLMSAVIAQLKGGEWNVKKEAAWVVANVATTGTPEHVRMLVSLGVVEPLVDMLDSEDARMLLVVMDAVGAILAVGKKLACGGAAYDFAGLFDDAGLPGRLEELQSHAQEDVYARAIAIIEAYFNNADDAGEEEPQQTATFGFGAAHSGTAAFSFTQPAGAAQFSSHGVGGGVAPVQLFSSPAVHQQAQHVPVSRGDGFAGLHFPNAMMAVPTPSVSAPPSVFAFNAVTFV